MLVRMMDLGTQITAVLAAAAVGAGGLIGATSDDGSGSDPRTALVIDAAAARDGRDLVHAGLEDAAAEVRLPRTAEEARTSVRYMAELGMRVVVAGPQSTAAANDAGLPAVNAANLAGALAAAGR
jgi:hypothetical protein